MDGQLSIPLEQMEDAPEFLYTNKWLINRFIMQHLSYILSDVNLDTVNIIVLYMYQQCMFYMKFFQLFYN